MLKKVFLSSGWLPKQCNSEIATLWETNMAMENGPFEDAFPIEHGDFPLPCSFTGVYVTLGSGKKSQISDPPKHPQMNRFDYET